MNILNLFRNGNVEPLETEFDYAEWAKEMDQLSVHPTPAPVSPALAVARAHEQLSFYLSHLQAEDERLAATIADLTERLRQVRVTRAALTVAFEALDADMQKTEPRVPQVAQVG